MSQIWFNAIRAGDIAFVRANATKYRGTRNKHNETGLVYAIKHNRVDIASFLIPYERNLILDGAFTPLMVCALYNCVDVAIILSASGHSAVNSEMQTALMIAAERDHAKIIQIILPNEVMRRDSRDRTALMLASISGQNKAVELLLPQEGGFVNSHKETAFYLALYHNNLSTAKILEPVEANTWCDKLVSVVGMCLSDPKTTEYIQYLAYKYPNMEKAYRDFCGQAGTSLSPYKELRSIAELRPLIGRSVTSLSPSDARTNKALVISPIPNISSPLRSSRSVNSRPKGEHVAISQSIQNSANELERFKDSYITSINQLRRDVESLQKQFKVQAQTQSNDPPRSSTGGPRYQKTPTVLRQSAVTPTSLPRTIAKDEAHIVHSFTSSPPRVKRVGGDVTTLCNEIIVSFVKSMGTNPLSPRSPSKPTRSNSNLKAIDNWNASTDSMQSHMEQAVNTNDTLSSLPSSKTTSTYINYNKQMQSKLLTMFNQKHDRSLGWNSNDSSFFSQSTANREREEYKGDIDGPDGLASILTRSVPISAQPLQSPRAFEIVYDQITDTNDSEHLNVKIPLLDKEQSVYNNTLTNSTPYHEIAQSPKNTTSIFMGTNSIVQQQNQQEDQYKQSNDATIAATNQGLMDTIENFTQIIDDLSNENILLNKELDRFKRMQRQLYDENKTDKQTIELLRKQLDSMAHNFSESTKRDIYTMKKEIARLDNSLMDAKRLELELSRVVDDDDADQITDESLML
ncbi:Protein 21.1 [Giardia lamblia P15]|uniref:Protein 21.1 n=1 Tax=Giardia intestinalis (strain P15) TaxID=658858 RepID=E1F569_GIAIA|nr:Protein 21.1 [Giardia lamblia P15]